MITAKEARERCLIRDETYKPKEFKVIEDMINKEIENGTSLFIKVRQTKVPHLTFKDVKNYFLPLGYSVHLVGIYDYQISWEENIE